MKLNYFIIPLIVLSFSLLGSAFTSDGIDSGWYDSIIQPSGTQPGSVIGMSWTTIFILTAIAALIVWNTFPRSKNFRSIIQLFLMNGAVNVLWSVLFFGSHAIGAAVIVAMVIEVTVIALIVCLWPVSPRAALLLFPYAGWVFFAIYLNSIIFSLNR